MGFNALGMLYAFGTILIYYFEVAICDLKPAAGRTTNMKHNQYFDGKVQSLGVNTPEGYAAVGVIEPGTYTFSTNCEERMVVIAGSMKVKMPDGQSRQVSAKDQFIVPPNVSFQVDAPADVAYICYYKK